MIIQPKFPVDLRILKSREVKRRVKNHALNNDRTKMNSSQDPCSLLWKYGTSLPINSV